MLVVGMTIWGKQALQGLLHSSSAYFLVLTGIFMFFICIQVMGIILNSIGYKSGIKIKFYNPDGTPSNEVPIVYYTDEGNNVIYKITGYAKLVNLSLKPRTIESVRIEFKVKKELLKSIILSQFPIGTRMELLDIQPRTIDPIPISTDLNITKYELTQLQVNNHSKVNISLIFEATGGLFKQSTKAKFRRVKHNTDTTE